MVDWATIRAEVLRPPATKKETRVRRIRYIAFGIAVNFAFCTVAFSEVNEVKIARQLGIAYLPLYVVQQERLIEKYAHAAGLPDLKVQWLQLSGGSALNDAILSGSADYVAGGTLIQLWDKTNGNVRGIAGLSDVTFTLLSSNAKVRKLEDISEGDKIAVPAVQSSGQAIVLQMLAEKTWGASNYGQLDRYTVSMRHADAALALRSARSGVDLHFSAPPYDIEELRVPGVHKVLDSNVLFGRPITQAMLYATTKFGDANPKIQQAIFNAMLEADKLIAADHQKAAQIYLSVTKEKLPMETLLKILDDPASVRFSVTPTGTFEIASFMKKTGRIKSLPASWRPFYFAELKDLAGS